MKIYVINLARCKQRRKHITRQLKATGSTWEWVEGVDARKADDDLLGPQYVTPEFRASASGIPTPERGVLRPGAVGCALAQRSAFERFIASGEPCALMLEDDVELPVDLPSLAESVGTHMSSNRAEVVLFNFHKPGCLELRDANALALASNRFLAVPADLCNLSSGAAYVVTREAARRLLCYGFPMKAFSDEWGLFVQEGVLESVRVVVAMPVRQSPAFRTTIDYYLPGSLQWLLRELVSFARVDRLPGLREVASRRRLRDMERWGALGAVRVLPPMQPTSSGPHGPE